MDRARLNERTVSKLKARDKEYIVFDRDLPRFGVRVLTTGRKTFLVQYRSGGRTRKVAIDTYPPMTAKEARQRALELLGAVGRGGNPAEERRENRRAPTVAVLCDRFMAEHVAHRCKPSTRAEYRRSVDLFIKRRLGSFKLGDVKRADIAQLHHDLRHIPFQANRTLGVLSRMFSLAELWGLTPDGTNPCRHVRKYPEGKRNRYLNDEEYGRLRAVLSELEAEQPVMRSAINAIRLLVLTGCRLGEIQTLRWDYVREKTIDLPDGKTGGRRIPITPKVREVLDSIDQLPDNPYVISGFVPGQHLTDLQRPWRRIRERAGLDGVRIHDLRHSYASSAVRNGKSLYMVGKLLGHRQLQTTSRYAHIDDASLHEAASEISSGIAAAQGEA